MQEKHQSLTGTMYLTLSWRILPFTGEMASFQVERKILFWGKLAPHTSDLCVTTELRYIHSVHTEIKQHWIAGIWLSNGELRFVLESTACSENGRLLRQPLDPCISAFAVPKYLPFPTWGCWHSINFLQTFSEMAVWGHSAKGLVWVMELSVLCSDAWISKRKV